MFTHPDAPATTWIKRSATEPMQKRPPGNNSLEEHIGAVEVEVTSSDLREIDRAISPITILGDRSYLVTKWS